MRIDKVTRREFIQLASMAAASLALSGCISARFVDKFAQKGKNTGDYPVVVIGSGIGGLASAVYLSRAGFPVTVIEQHSIPGGYATAFRRGDFNFDVSLHFFSAPEQEYRELGIEGKVERIPLALSRRIISPDADIVVPEFSSPDFIELIMRVYPDEKGFPNYFEYCREIVDEAMRFVKNVEGSYVFLPLVPLEYPKMWELRRKTFSDVLDRFFKNPAAKSSMSGICELFGLPPSRTSGFMAAVVTGSMFKEDFRCYYFKSRSQDLSNALAAVIEENKGTLVFGKTVNNIITADNRVTGVRTEDGTAYPAKFVVSNANAPDTFGKLLSDNPAAKGYMEKIAKYKPSISSFLVWLGLNRELGGEMPLGITIQSGFDSETDFKNYQACNAEKCPIEVALYDSYFKGYSKPGTSTLTIMILSGYDPWRRFEKDYFAGKKEAYMREKERIARILVKRIEEKAIPGLSSMIQVMEAATPLTNLRFTRNPEGAIYGYPYSVDNAFINRMRNPTPIKGLYLSSGWGSNAGSYTGGIMNGREVHRLIMKDV